MAHTTTQVTPDMTPQAMREFFLQQTRSSLESWEQSHFPIQSNPPFDLDNPAAIAFRFTPELAEKIALRKQVDDFAAEAKVSTAGVRENQDVLCSWDHRYRINEFMFALIAEALVRLVKELQPIRVAKLPKLTAAQVADHLGKDGVTAIEEIYGRPLAEAIEFARENPIRIVGGEVRSNTPRYVGLMSRIYAGRGLYVFGTEDPGFKDTSTIFLWSFLTYLLGLSGGDYFTSSHGAPQKQSDKILAQDGAQYLPDLYERIVLHLYDLLGTIEKDGYTVEMAAIDDPHLMHTLTYTRVARLYGSYLRKGPASPAALSLIQKAIAAGLRLKLDFFGGAGGKSLSAMFEELGVLKVFDGGLIRTEEDPFFHNVGFRVSQKKGSSDYEVVHDSVDASLPVVVKSAGYDVLLKDAPEGQLVFNVDPDADRFVVGQIVPTSERAALDSYGISYLELGSRLFAVYSPNQFFLMLAENDRVVAVQDGDWPKFSNFDIHTYVSALAWDEWADTHKIPYVRVPVGFKEIAAIVRQVEEISTANPGQPIVVKNELGEATTIGAHPKLHHAGEESGGKIGGPREPIYNLFGESVLGMREKSSGEACFSAISLAARLWLEADQAKDPRRYYLHSYLESIFQDSHIANPMEFRGDIVHYNEAIFDPAELAKAKQTGIEERVVYNAFFSNLAEALTEPKRSRTGHVLTLEQIKTLLAEAMPGMTEQWATLERIDHWSDGLQFWFKPGGKVRDLCLRASGTDAKSKVYLDGTDKTFLSELFLRNFKDFKPHPSENYRKLIVTGKESGRPTS
jgi:phosphomannomutase